MAIFPVASDSVNLDTAQVETTDVWANGFRMNPVTGGVRAVYGSGVSYVNGVPVDANGCVALVDSSAGLPGDTTWSNGIPLSAQKVCVSSGAMSTYSNGLPMAANGGIGGQLVPSLGLYFLGTSALDPRITFTRADATSCATYFDSTGRLQTAAANVARFDYDPATPLGVTGGELVTNGDFSQGTSGWAINNGATISIVNGALRVTNGGSFGGSFRSTPIGLTIGKRYRVTFDYLGGTSTAVSANTVSGQVIGPFTTSVGTKTADFVAMSTNFFFFIDGTTGNYGDFDNFSIQEVTFTPRGLLIEESRTNLLLQSRDMTQAAWSKTDVTPTRNQVGIDGTANSACLMTEGSAGNAVTTQNGAAVAAGSAVTGSIVLKKGNTQWVLVMAGDNGVGNGAQVYVDLTNGVLGTTSVRGTGTSATSSITSLGGGWYRVTLSSIPSGTNTQSCLQWLSATANNNSTRIPNATYIVDAAQLEVGSFATSIITTTAATVTRAADSASMTGTNFSSWYNTASGTMVAEYVGAPIGPSGNSIWKTQTLGGPAISDNDASNNVRVSLLSVAYEDTGGTATTQGTVYKTAFAYQASNYGSSTNGGTVQTTADATAPTSQTSCAIGSDAGTKYANTWIRRLTYYPTRLSNAQLQALTA